MAEAWHSSHSSGSFRFLNTTISEGSVTTRLRCGEIFTFFVNRNLLLSLLVKDFENRLAFGEVGGKNRVVRFSEHGIKVSLTEEKTADFCRAFNGSYIHL